ncbi:MAG: SCO family protein [Ectothiorhodospiraceae bacterium]|nr:SCO family protein [Ectothiorhodospiraceae bacterium]
MSNLLTTPRQSLKVVLSLVLAALLVGMGLYINRQTASVDNSAQDSTAPSIAPIEAQLPVPRPLTLFQLTAHDLKPLDNARLKGKWTLLFFGYTHCPDVCPTTLTELAQTVRLLEPAVLAETQFVFVSVDPRRDSPASLADYVTYFDERFIGATGSIDELAVLVRQLDSKFALGTDLAGEPIVNHSSAMLLIDPQVRYYARLKAPHYSEEIQAQYLALRKAYLGRI